MAVLLVFLKPPVAGKVKTRLAATIGDEAAATLYRGWTKTIFERMQSIRSDVEVIAYFDDSSHHSFDEWLALADGWWPQPGGDLGERLAAGFATAHGRGGAVVAIGTDCPDIMETTVRSAFERLRSADVVLGPATDGGYYLVGAARPFPGLFDNIPWSTEKTFDEQVERCRENQWKLALLPALSDIDTWDDWTKYRTRQQENECPTLRSSVCRSP